MRVLHGRAADRTADRRVTAELLDTAGDRREPAARVWTPHRHLAFGRRDTHEPGYEEARQAAAERGFAPVERSVGGRAVAYTGTTLAFALAVPIEDMRTGLDDRYDDATGRVREALASLGIDVERGEPVDSFCPGAHSLSAKGKVVGIAQRVRSNAALVSGVVIVADHEEIAGVLDPVYDALGVPFDPGTVGSIARAGGPADPETVARAIEGALVGEREARIEHVDRKP